MKKLMNNKEYHLHEAIGSTTLKTIANKSVLHMINQEFKESDSMILGSAVHTALLEPENFKKEYIVAPNVDKRTKAGKETWALFESKANGKIILKEDQMDVVAGIKSSILSHDIAKNMLSSGSAEYSYFIKDKETSFDLKCRPDYVNKDCLIDLKTCQDASPNGFTKAVANFGYHIQAAFYLDVFNLANNTDYKEFYFIAVETSKPFALAIYKMDEFAIDEGRGLYRKALRDFKFYKDSEKEGNVNLHNFSYGNEILNLELPNWAYKGA